MSAALQIPQRARETVAVRDGHYCARCGVSIVDRTSSVHHRLARSVGGSTDPRINDLRNLIQLCGSGITGCHGFVHSHPKMSWEHGWIIRSFDELDRPMRSMYGSRIVLTEDGERDDIWPFDDVLRE